MGTRSIISALVTACALLVFCGPAMSQQLPRPVKVQITEVPLPVGHAAPTDPDLQDKTWNRWETPNFVILSLDANQGAYLYGNIEKIKTWIFGRWGLPDITFPKRVYKSGQPSEPGCMLVCVPNKEYLDKLFRLKGSQSEVQTDNQGKITRSVAWISLDDTPPEVIPSAITTICLKEFEQQTNAQFSPWVYRGMSHLNATIPQIKQTLSPLANSVQQNQNMYFSKSIFEMSGDAWSKLDQSQQRLFDAEATAMCLLLRKEFGQVNFLTFLRGGVSEQSLKASFGFNGYNQLDATFKRYMYNLSNDINTNRTPDHYLQVNPPKKR